MIPHVRLKMLFVGCSLASTVACHHADTIGASATSEHEYARQGKIALRIDPVWQNNINTKGVQAYRPTEPYGVASTTGGMVVVAAFNGQLHAYQARSGNWGWTIDLKEKPGTPPTSYGDTIFIGMTDGRVLSINGHTGEENWATTLDNIVHGQPTVANDVVYVQTSEEAVVALHANTGDKMWTYRHPRIAEMELLGGGRPSVIDDMIYVGFSDGSLYKLNAQGHSVWNVDLSSGRRRMVDVDSPPLRYQSSVIAVSNNGGVFSVDQETGAIQWQLEERGVQTPMLMGDSLICATTNGRILWVDPNTGKIQQELVLSTTGLTAPMRLTDTTFAVADSARGVLIIDGTDPFIHAIFNATVGISGPMAIYGDMVYALINRGKVYGLKLRKI